MFQVAEFHPGSGFEPTANPVKFYTESEQKKSVGGSCSADCGACMPPPASSQATLGGVLGGVAVLLVVVIIISVILAYRRRGHCPAPATSEFAGNAALVEIRKYFLTGFCHLHSQNNVLENDSYSTCWHIGFQV